MTAIVHRTPGLIDIRSFTTMGMSAKVGDNPLGQFGTGLKYAIAVLVRAGARPVVWIGRDRYEFFCEATDFRGKEFQLVRMRVKKWGGLRTVNHNLPFTTEYGKNWKMWMAFRELEANTRDEDGETLPFLDDEQEFITVGCDGHTTIVVEHPDYVEAWEKRDEVFLPEGLSVRSDTEGLQVLGGEAQRVYYRGMRAMDPPKKTLATYNVLSDIEITEDRTIKYPHQVRDAIAHHVVRSDDEALIERVVTAKEEWFEHELEFPQYITPSDAFRAVMRRRPKGLSARVSTYYSHHDTVYVPSGEDALGRHPRPWKIGTSDVRDANNKVVFDCPYGYQGRWDIMATELVRRLGYLERGEPGEDAKSFGEAAHEADSRAHFLGPAPEDDIGF